MEAAKTSCQSFLEELAAGTPTPGGGGASALAGALGAALAGMVGHYTAGKERYASVEEEIKAVMAEGERLRARLLALVDEDAAAFLPLSQAYGMEKDAPGRDAVMEQALRRAAEPPMEMLRLCARSIALHRVLAEKGSVLMVSDAGTGAALCLGALYGAALNVKANTKAMKDRDYARRLNEEADRLTAEYGEMALRVYEAVAGRMV